VRPARTEDEVQAALRLRYRVFCEEQGVDLAAEQDGRDGEALQLIALDGARVVGTCRVLIDDGIARLGRMAVEPGLRGRGMGSALLTEADSAMLEAGARRIRLHAQTASRGVYERAGYAPQGGEFMEEGIEHVAMEKPLAGEAPDA
jgi:predicted GNAT family N-acyltransferase